MEATALSDLRHGVLGKSAGKQAIARYDSLARRRDLLRYVRGRRNHERETQRDRCRGHWSPDECVRSVDAAFVS
jgi:hypothetical protein